MIGVGVAGYGYWGPNLARNVAAQGGARLVAIADPDPDARKRAARDHPAARILADPQALVQSDDIDAVVIAAPAACHEPLARTALEAERHVLAEKPGAPTGAAMRALGALAARAERVLMVDHTFVYAPAVEALAALLAGGLLGDPLFVEMTRTSLARFDPQLGVIRDLAVHDFAILSRVLGRKPSGVTARGGGPPGEPEDLALIGLDYEGGPVAQIRVDCFSPVKLRRVLVGGRRGLAIYDDIEPVEKLKLFRRDPAAATDPAVLTALRTGFRTGAAESPAIPLVEPLSRMVAHFIACIESGSQPLTGAAFAADILDVAGAAERSLAAGGALVAL